MSEKYLQPDATKNTFVAFRIGKDGENRKTLMKYFRGLIVHGQMKSESKRDGTICFERELGLRGLPFFYGDWLVGTSKPTVVTNTEFKQMYEIAHTVYRKKIG